MIKCIAVDDEPLSLDLLEDNIRKVPFLQLVKRCSNAAEAGDALRAQPVDLMFLDIQMPGISGIQFLQSFSKQPPLVIFITAYEQYALEGFNLDVVDYLLKPVPFERFLKAVNKAYDKLHAPVRMPATQEETPTHIFVNADYSLVKIMLADITHIEGLKDYVKIFLTSSSRPVITRMSMKGVEEKLAGNKFVRVHKSFIVAVDKIVSIRKSRITIGNATIPISEGFKENLDRFLNL